MAVLAIIAELRRYPVKSMAGESLAAASLTLHGLSGDREYAFVRAEARSDFPWLTARELPEMLLYQPQAAQDGGCAVRTPAGQLLPVAGAALREELEACSGRRLFLLRNHLGSFDSAPLSLLSRATVEQLGAEAAVSPDARRFRPNVVLDLSDPIGFAELAWQGRILRLGAVARIAITKLDRRCGIPNLDPDSAISSPAVLQAVVARHDQCAGVYATVLVDGEVHPGAALTD